VNQNPSQNTVRKAWRAALLVSLLVSVIHIQAQTQAAMNAQARAEFVKVDAELNRTYEALLAKLPDAESKEKLKQSQRAWVAFRDAEATFALIRHAAVRCQYSNSLRLLAVRGKRFARAAGGFRFHSKV